METIRIKYFGDMEPIEKIGGKKSDWIDLRAAEDVVMEIGEFKLIPLGVAMQLPEGFEAIMAPRSSTFKNYGIIMTNSIGIIDETFCGDNDQWHFPAYALKANAFINGKPCVSIKKGERICQFRILKHQPSVEFQVVESLGNADRGGIGSTGTV